MNRVPPLETLPSSAETVAPRVLRRLAAAVIVALCSSLLWTGPTVSGQSQLNDHCVVSILNRTAQVRADGSWELPNVPTGFGPVRARATCVENGITRSGQSDLFTIVPGRMNAIPPIVLGPTTPIPVALNVSSSAPVLFKPGQTAQLTVLASYAAGPVQNVTQAGTGTTYLTTNPAIATVSTNGLVTAVRSGTIIVRATNEGTPGMTTIEVRLAGDSDNDGIPDDLELANGLNPNDPTDALLDPDKDGLNNRDEIAAGTLLNVADSDGDGILDGEEVRRGIDGFITNPLFADTDGDGVRDGLEISTKSDPTDPQSVNLAAALKSIGVAPDTFIITVNSVQGVGFQQLTVTGQLQDGTTIDLTSTKRGTNYLSSALTVCSFGAPDGRVFGGLPGSCTISITNSGFKTQSSGTVRNFTPIALGNVAIPGYANNVDVNGNFAYVAAGSTGLQVVNVANPAAPVIVAALDTLGNANDVRVVGNRAYIADGTSGLRIIDVTNPLAPANLGGYDTSGEANDVIVSGSVAYVADGLSGVQIIDVSNPAAPTLIRTVDTPGTARGVDVENGFVVVVDDSPAASVQVIDVTQPANATIVGSVPIGGNGIDIDVANGFAVVAAYTDGVKIVDVRAPTAPAVVGSLPGSAPNGFVPRDVQIAGEFAVFAEQLFATAIAPIVDIGNPATPFFRGFVDFGQDYAGTGVAVSGGFVYWTGRSFFVGDENGVNGTTRLFIGQYIARDDLNGIPPTVAITAPADGSSIIEGQTITLRANADDDVAVASVAFSVNKAAVFTDTSEPFETTFTAPAAPATLLIGARASDLGNNTADAATVSVNVIPDPLTTVSGRVVDAMGAPVPGATVAVFGTFTGLTGPTGTFSIPNVPTARGGIVVEATATIAGVAHRGSSGTFSPVPGGTTDVGQIALRSGRKVAIYGAPGSSTWNLDVKAKLESTGLFTQVDAFMVSGGQPVPTLAQLLAYDAVFVYSDTSFNNATSIGNVLADYMDAGGGVVLATFAFWEGNGLGILGRVKTAGYLPFTTAGQNSPGNLTLVPIVPAHPILAGVTSFNGGTSSYHNASITTTAGATLVANWSNGQPLVATKQPTAGRIVGLNFYPPSSAARGDFWNTTTKGALLMGNALIWAAR